MSVSTTLAAVRERAAAGRAFDPDPEITVRGTVVVLPGRGEHAGVYQRFGRRLATDGYAVRVLDDPAAVGLRGRPLADLYRDVPRPLVLAGTDTGALRALAVAAGGDVNLDGILLLGVASTTAATFIDADWASELDARTACPVHRDRLSQDTKLIRGALSRPIPIELTDLTRWLDPAVITTPALIVHGSSDRVAPQANALALADRLCRCDVAIVSDGRHDIVNDIHHRSVAARIVLWLEALRTGAPILSAD